MGHYQSIAKIFLPSEIGFKGEEIAVNFLKKKGLKILTRNYRFKKKEIDIIAEDKGTICFIEVKTRIGKEFGLPEEAVTIKKRKHLITLATNYLKRFNLLERNIRFDVVSILCYHNKPIVNYIKNAFISDTITV